ncbi:MAG: YebC/PmpR family DNA-binding transcriptional regulator [Verrucomicrobiae bacterium]|nr:YebC/PmpR family DNA-binding transcriptional regulator [Verrucomicrobiae bacterium]
MAGHSHWANIQRTKGAADFKRGKLFSKLSREIAMAARLGGGNPEFNPRLRAAIDAARSQSMPNDNIDRAVKKGSGELEGASLEEMTYEGYGAGGVAFLVECMSDNRNRTSADVRAAFAKYEGHLAGAGSVSWMFHKKAVFTFASDRVSEEQLMEASLDAGAEDIRSQGGLLVIIAPFDRFDAVSTAIKKAGLVPDSAKPTFIPTNTSTVTTAESARLILDLYEALEDHDDVQNVHANFDIPDDILAALK